MTAATPASVAPGSREASHTRQGRLILWCESCREYFPVKGDRPVCPRCGRPPLMRRCARCGHEWVPRTYRALSGACPACRSPYWCRTRVRGPPGRRD